MRWAFASMLVPDSGWLYVIAGIVICAAALLIPARNDLELLRRQRDQLIEEKNLIGSRLTAYANFIDALDAAEPGLVKRLAASQLNVVPANVRPVLLTRSPSPTLNEWIDSTVLVNREPDAVRPAPSHLERLVEGKNHLWVIGGAVLCIFVGLLLSPGVIASRLEETIDPESPSDGEDGSTGMRSNSREASRTRRSDVQLEVRAGSSVRLFDECDDDDQPGDHGVAGVTNDLDEDAGRVSGEPAEDNANKDASDAPGDQLILFSAGAVPEAASEGEFGSDLASGAEAFANPHYSVDLLNDIEDESDVLDEDEPIAFASGRADAMDSPDFGEPEPASDPVTPDREDAADAADHSLIAAALAKHDASTQVVRAEDDDDVADQADEYDYDYVYVDDDGNEIDPNDDEYELVDGDPEIADEADELVDEHEEPQVEGEYEYVYVDEDGNEIDPADGEYEFVDVDASGEDEEEFGLDGDADRPAAKGD